MRPIAWSCSAADCAVVFAGFGRLPADEPGAELGLALLSRRAFAVLERVPLLGPSVLELAGAWLCLPNHAAPIPMAKTAPCVRMSLESFMGLKLG